ncbi:MAG: ThuA domain-containing protein [Oligoflexales bacterium]|nr:ThuA domain-containing protein [Oligoflexales bacterium]
MGRKKAILLGNYHDAPYHPLGCVQDEIIKIFESEIDVEVTGDHSILETGRLGEYDLCISYVDCWERDIPEGQLAGLVSFVEGGKGFLAVHNGISYQKTKGYRRLVGARFTGHPPIQELNFIIAEPRHPITRDLDGFRMVEEPYQYEFEPDAVQRMHHLLHYELDGRRMSAGWTFDLHRGRVAYLMPGHEKAAFLTPVFREMLLRAGMWACFEL